MEKLFKLRKNEKIRKINTIEGYENIRDFYCVTSSGNVVNIDTKQNLTKKEKHTGDYVRVTLTTNEGKQISELVHVLVAKAFIPNENPENFIEVDHINNDKTCNSVYNLRWITPQKNRKRRKLKKYYCVVYDDNKIMKGYNSISKASKDMKIAYHKIYRAKLTNKQRIKGRNIKVYFIER